MVARSPVQWGWVGASRAAIIAIALFAGNDEENSLDFQPVVSVSNHFTCLRALVAAKKKEVLCFLLCVAATVRLHT